MYRLALLVFFIGCFGRQNSVCNSNLFQNEIRIIAKHTDSLTKITDDSLKHKLNSEVMKEMIKIVASAKSFSLPLDSLKSIGKTYSPDKKFRIITWNVLLKSGIHIYNCIMQFNPEKDSTCRYIILNDSSENFKENISNLVFTPKKWYGTLYYEILECKIEKKQVYILLGKHFNDLFSNRKIIESLYFNEAGMPVFGYPVFRDNNIKVNRVVFDYSINASMMLRYDNRLEMIIFDHLAPPSNVYAGDYKFYGPDFTYDGFKFEKNSWVFHPNINFRDFNNQQDKNKLKDKKPRTPGIK